MEEHGFVFFTGIWRIRKGRSLYAVSYTHLDVYKRQAQMKEAVQLIDGRAETECSGNITKENIELMKDLGVNYVSSGALTHSAPILDISLKHLSVLGE